MVYGSASINNSDYIVCETDGFNEIDTVGSFRYDTILDAAFIPFSNQNAWLKTCQVKRQISI